MILLTISFKKSQSLSSASCKITCIDLLFCWVILNLTSLMVLVYFIMKILDGPFQVSLITFTENIAHTLVQSNKNIYKYL
jgi:hypothetical protein